MLIVLLLIGFQLTDDIVTTSKHINNLTVNATSSDFSMVYLYYIRHLGISCLFGIPLYQSLLTTIFKRYIDHV